MKKYETIEHPSDTGIIAYGKGLKEAFKNAAYGMMDTIYDISKADKKDKFNIKVEGEDVPSLLVNWLSEILYLSDAKNEVISGFEINKFNDKMLSAVVFGEKFDPEKHIEKTGIKAVTYDQLDVSKVKDNYKIKVIFDV